MKKLFTSVLVLTLIFGSIGVANAFGGPRGNMGYNQQNIQKPYYNQQNIDLDLNDDQEEKLEDIQENFWEEREEKSEELMESNEELRELYFNNANKEEIEKLKDKIKTLQTELNQIRFNYLNEVKNILTDEQLNELEESTIGFGMQGNYNNQGFRGHRGQGYCY